MTALNARTAPSCPGTASRALITSRTDARGTTFRVNATVGSRLSVQCHHPRGTHITSPGVCNHHNNEPCRAASATDARTLRQVLANALCWKITLCESGGHHTTSRTELCLEPIERGRGDHMATKPLGPAMPADARWSAGHVRPFTRRAITCAQEQDVRMNVGLTGKAIESDHCATVCAPALDGCCGADWLSGAIKHHNLRP